MKEAAIGLQEPIVTHCQTSGIPNPADGPLHDPAAAMPPQAPPILVGGLLIVRAGRADELNAPTFEKATGPVAVIAAIRNQAGGIRPEPPRPVRAGDFAPPIVRAGSSSLRPRLDWR